MSNIEQNVMRRVRAIHFLRPIFSAYAASAIVCAAALYGIGREVWVAKVFENGPSNLLGKSGYLVYAFEHTRIIVQALTVLALACAMYLARETAKIITHAFIPARA